MMSISETEKKMLFKLFRPPLQVSFIASTRSGCALLFCNRFSLGIYTKTSHIVLTLIAIAAIAYFTEFSFGSNFYPPLAGLFILQ